MTTTAAGQGDTAHRTASFETPAARAWRRLTRRKSAMLGLVIIVVPGLVAILAPFIAPHDPKAR